ncbi:hypothetical protein [Vagococcus fluvialis]|uniref:hypothetical protein n=1 Tax=Vagococcus fluvialis TaxID=2738 RepID=UPI002033D207|nr:hypothetical protein [Vagococcus fluvialis]MCM2138832.1 hypothetical protein [Vagococcus fluvialis]
MKSKVELNSNGVNYLHKGEVPTVIDKGALRTKLTTKRGKVTNEFEVSNELMSLWFSEVII